VRSATPPQGFMASRNLLINAGICYASGVPIGSLRRTQMSRKPDPRSRLRDTCSSPEQGTITPGGLPGSLRYHTRDGRHTATVQARWPDLIRVNSSSSNRPARALSSRREDQVRA
jgi:hypothetical protein